MTCLALAACGGTSDQTSAAAKCLKIAVLQHTLGGDNCGDPTVLTVAGKDTPSVTCTHDNGNSYVCHVKTADPSFDYLHIGDHFYNVVYDGKSITYQQTQ